MRATQVIVVMLALAVPAAAAAQGRGRARGQGGGRNPETNQPETIRFAGMDRNRDGVITRGEWRGSDRSFQIHDWNNDGVLSGDEIRPDADGEDDDRDDRFSYLDANRDGRVTYDEWHSSRAVFEARDTNHDGRLSRAELEGGPRDRGEAYRAGYDRGLQEGRAAGREDNERHQGWDLEGQRELESADSGYEGRLGSRADYQAGYRDGFRRGYPQGFGPR